MTTSSCLEAPAHAKKRESQDALVSVIIPCGQTTRFLGEAIESVVAQTYRSVEIIVVTNALHERTDLRSCKHASILRVSHGHEGLSGARNQGLAVSRGRYVVFLDAEDRLLPHAVESGLASLDRHPDIALVY